MNGVLAGNTVAIVDLIVEDSDFTENYTNSQGASITIYKFIELSQTARITGCTFTSNVSNRGPGVYLEYQTGVITVQKCLFSLNASAKGSALMSHQYPTYETLSMVVLIDNTFIANSQSAAVVIDGWELNINLSSYRNTFIGNSAGAVYSTNGNFYDEDSVYINNTAKLGTGCRLVNSVASIRNATFIGNKALNNGGVFFLSGRSLLLLENSLMANNTASGFGGVFYADEVSTLKVFNSAFRGNRVTSQGASGYHHHWDLLYYKLQF